MPETRKRLTAWLDRRSGKMGDFASPSGGAMAQPMRDPTANMIAGRMPRIRDLLTVINTSSGSVDYVNQTTRDNQAAP